MKETIMSLKLELMSYKSSGNDIVENLYDSLEGADVSITTEYGQVFSSKCYGGNIEYISETDGYKENIILDNNESKLCVSFIKSKRNSLELGDVVEILEGDKYIRYLVMKLSKRVFLYSDIMNNALAHEFNFTNLEELSIYLENNYLKYKIYQRI